MVLALHGSAASPGLAIGPAWRLDRPAPAPRERRVPPEAVPREVARLRAALRAAAAEIEALRRRLPASLPGEVGAFLETHRLMLADPALARAPLERIRRERWAAEWALELERRALAAAFEALEDPYLRARRVDVEQVVARVQRLLAEGGRGGTGAEEAEAPRGAVVVCADLDPGTVALLADRGATAIVAEGGGPLSHGAILARSLGLPCVMGARGALALLRDGETLIVDGHVGAVLAGADRRLLAGARRRRRGEHRARSALRRLKGEPARTRDGLEVVLRANVELAPDVQAARRVGAAGVGLYRTEFLFAGRETPPSEEEQYRAYARMVRAMRGLPVTIRTLDLGADKTLGTVPAPPPGTSPALGLRAVRLCLREPAMFLAQIRAILRASAHGPVRLLVPMLASVRELEQVLALVARAKSELAREGRRFDPHLPVGAMIEVPGAALAAGRFARRLDFLAIGSNDLVQYTLAVDRADERVAHLYDPLHPAVLQLVRAVVHAGRRAGVPVSLCGEMAADPRYTRLLLGLGVTELSVHPLFLPEVKAAVRSARAADAVRLARRILAAPDTETAERLLERLNAL